MVERAPTTADDEPTFEERVAELAALVGSPNRVSLLLELHREGECGRDDLRDAVDASRTTVQRNLDALEERGWVANTSVEYRITPCGAFVARGLRDLLDTTGVAAKLRDALRWVPRSAVDFDLAHLADAEVTLATPANPHAPVNRHARSLEAADRFRGVVSTVNLAAFRAATPRDADGRWEVVLSADALETLESSPVFADRFAELRAADCADVYACGRRVPFSLGLVDDAVQLGVEDDDGVPKALVVTRSEAVREWAEDAFADYRRQATAVTAD